MNSIRFGLAVVSLSLFGLATGCVASAEPDDQTDEDVGTDQAELMKWGNTDTCPDGQYFCSFNNKCISNDLKCPGQSYQIYW